LGDRDDVGKKAPNEHSRSGISLTGFALVPVAVADEMHEWAGQEQQVRQGGQDVTGMRQEQIASQCRKEEANHKSRFRMKKTEGGVHGGFSSNGLAAVTLFWPVDGSQDPERNQINERHENQYRPERGKTDPAKDAADRVEHRCDHDNEEKPMDRSKDHRV